MMICDIERFSILWELRKARYLMLLMPGDGVETNSPSASCILMDTSMYYDISAIVP